MTAGIRIRNYNRRLGYVSSEAKCNVGTFFI